MFSTLRNAWKVADLRKKLIFTFLVILLYRVCNVIPVPFVNTDALAASFNQQMGNTILGLYNIMSGSAFSQATILALAIQPYINASIIIQLLTIAIPPLERLSKEGGEEGRKKIERITRYTTVGLGLLMGTAYFFMLRNTFSGILLDESFLAAVVIILSFTAGSAFVMWLGEQITEFGVGNGISIILFANIVSRLPYGTINMVTNLINDFKGYWYIALVTVIGMALMMVFIVFVTQAERRIPVQYAKRVVGRKIYGGQSSNLPIKVNMTGVLPIIFAQSICSLPATFAAFFNMNRESFWYKYVFSSTSFVYCLFYFLLIIGFSYFYATIQYNPVEIANNLKKNGGFIPGFRPGRPTSDFIARVINKITLFGALYLAVVALMPVIAGAILGTNSVSIGGTSVIIVVGVALETVAAIEAQMLMRHYKGFLE